MWDPPDPDESPIYRLMPPRREPPAPEPPPWWRTLAVSASAVARRALGWPRSQASPILVVTVGGVLSGLICAYLLSR